MKKKVVIISVLTICLVLWGIRYYTFNGTFALHTAYPREYYSMNDTIVYDENTMSYGVFYQPGYSISLKNARIVSLEDYLSETKMSKEDFSGTSEKYVELTFEISNNGDFADGITPYSFPIIGDNWYTFYDGEMTAYINEFAQDMSYVDMITVEKGKTATLKVAYNLFSFNFLPGEFENIENEDMWVYVSVKPISKYIKIELS